MYKYVMGVVIIILIIITIRVILVKKKSNKNEDNDIEDLKERLSLYKKSFIDGMEITEDTSSPIDNIALFMDSRYESLSMNEKLACSGVLYHYMNVLNIYLDQIDYDSSPKYNLHIKSDEWYETHNKHLSTLYINLLKEVYPQLIKNHKEEFERLSSYKYMEMDNAITNWLIDEEYKLNEKLTK